VKLYTETARITPNPCCSNVTASTIPALAGEMRLGRYPPAAVRASSKGRGIGSALIGEIVVRNGVRYRRRALKILSFLQHRPPVTRITLERVAAESRISVTRVLSPHGGAYASISVRRSHAVDRQNLSSVTQ
jgi:hypothetical protein